MSKFASVRDAVIYERADFDEQMSLSEGGDWYGIAYDFYGKSYLVHESTVGFVDVHQMLTAADATSAWEWLVEQYGEHAV